MKRYLAALGLFFALAPAPAFAQGCAMCYESAKAIDTGSQKALNRAILVLLVPTITFIGGAVGLAYKYRNPREQ